MPVINRIADFQAEMAGWRHNLHAHPETAFAEHRTAELVARLLESFGIAVDRGVARTGVIGTLVGYGLGLVITVNLEAIRQFLQSVLHVELFSAEIYFFTRIPARIDHGEVTAVVIMALALSFLATLYPSWRAARLDPVEGLRYE